MSKAEWEFICNLGQPSQPSATGAVDLLSSITSNLRKQRCIFIFAYQTAALFTQAKVDPDDMGQYRFYDGEIVELDKNVAFLLLLPPVSKFLQNASGSITDTPDFIHIPATYAKIGLYHTHTHRVLESSLWSLYQPNVYKTYARLAASLSNEIASLNHAARVALSSAESAAVKESLAAANAFQER